MNKPLQLQANTLINTELKRLLDMKPNDDKIGEIKDFLKKEATKIYSWKQEDYNELLEIIQSCQPHFRGRNGRIEYNNIQKLINSIGSIQKLKSKNTQIHLGERVQRILQQRR